MVSRLFVVNEWLLEDLANANGPIKREETYMFLQKLCERCDRLAILEPSPWTKKAYALMCRSDPTTRKISKYLRRMIWLNSAKCVLRRTDELSEVPQEFKKAELNSDEYLVDLYFSISADVLVTTDQKLHDALNPTGKVAVAMRDEFLKNYLRSK